MKQSPCTVLPSLGHLPDRGNQSSRHKHEGETGEEQREDTISDQVILILYLCIVISNCFTLQVRVHRVCGVHGVCGMECVFREDDERTGCMKCECMV